MADENTKTIDPIVDESIASTVEVESSAISTDVTETAPVESSESLDVVINPEPQVETEKPQQEPQSEPMEEPVEVVVPEPVKEPVKIQEVTPVIETKTVEIETVSSGSSISSVLKVEEHKTLSSADPVSQAINPTPAGSGPMVSQPSALEALGASFMANMKRARELLVKARAAVSLKRKKKLEKIMTLFIKKNKIVNQDVRDFLHTTEHTATDYLNALVKEGKIKREGKGSHSYYTRI